ncbi:hypothetical protein ACLKA7_005266 [Drosophila subpalustris]
MQQHKQQKQQQQQQKQQQQQHTPIKGNNSKLGQRPTYSQLRAEQAQQKQQQEQQHQQQQQTGQQLGQQQDLQLEQQPPSDDCLSLAIVQNTHNGKMDAMLDIIRDMLSRLLPVTPQKAQQQHQHIEPIVRIATANPNDMSVDSIVFAESSSQSKLAIDNGNDCQARSAWTPLSHEKRAKDKSHARCHLIYMHLEHSEKYPVSLPSQTQQQKHIEQCRPTSQTNRDDNNIDRRQSHPNYKKLIQINPLIARQQQHQHQQQQQHTHMQIEMAQNQPKGNILAIAQNNTAEKLTSKHLQNQLAAKCCMQHGETQRQNMEQQHQQQQHQHQQQQCDPATPVCQYTGSGACSPFNCHMLTATPMWQQHWQSASGKQHWALLFQPRPQNAHSSGTSAAATKSWLHSIVHIIPHAGASGGSSGGGRLWKTTTHGGISCGSSS